MNLNIFSKKLYLNITLMGMLASSNINAKITDVDTDLASKLLSNSLLTGAGATESEIIKKIIAGFAKDGLTEALKKIFEEAGFAKRPVPLNGIKIITFADYVGDMFGLGTSIFKIIKNNKKEDYSSNKARIKMYTYVAVVGMVRVLLQESTRVYGTDAIIEKIFGSTDSTKGTRRFFSAIASTAINIGILDKIIDAAAVLVACKIMNSDDLEEYLDNIKTLDDVKKASSSLSKIVLKFFGRLQ